LYGLTEASPVFFQSLPEDSDETRAETVGYPQEHTEIKIVDESDRIVPVGSQGEMCVRGFMTMQGYWGEPAMTAEAIDSARWFHTGDLFVLTETGHGKVVGRIKDMIIRGGENIYPKELEDFFHSHPSIVEAQVFGVPHDRLGEVVAAWLRVKEGATLTEKDVIAFCKGQISHFKIPQYIKFVREYPKTASGKIQKFVMRENMTAELGLKPDQFSKTIQ
jgi:fatty-acyl-CoA synthase